MTNKKLRILISSILVLSVVALVGCKKKVNETPAATQEFVRIKNSATAKEIRIELSTNKSSITNKKEAKEVAEDIFYRNGINIPDIRNEEERTIGDETYYILKQYHDGYKVLNSEIILRTYNKRLFSVNVCCYDIKKLNTNIRIDSNEAVKIADDYLRTEECIDDELYYEVSEPVIITGRQIVPYLSYVVKADLEEINDKNSIFTLNIDTLNGDVLGFSDNIVDFLEE